MKKGIKLILGLALILIVLAVSKPSEESFNKYTKEKYESVETSNSLEEIANKAMTNIKNASLNVQSSLTANYEDKIFFALASRDQMNVKESYLGILGFWVKIK
jgi:hypothetical protein